MMLRFIYGFLITGLTIFTISCGESKQPVIVDEAPSCEPAIDINSVQTILPQAGNVALIEANCQPCHSLRYIEMQPPLSYHAREKIVDKMIVTFGAPIRDTTARRDIINYLYAIKGEQGH